MFIYFTYQQSKTKADVLRFKHFVDFEKIKKVCCFAWFVNKALNSNCALTALVTSHAWNHKFYNKSSYKYSVDYLIEQIFLVDQQKLQSFDSAYSVVAGNIINTMTFYYTIDSLAELYFKVHMWSAYDSAIYSYLPLEYAFWTKPKSVYSKSPGL